MCFEDKNDQTWHRIKVSAYNYHVQMHHGVSFATGRPFDPPVQFRDVQVDVGGTQKTMPQGLCHSCKKWIDLDSSKPVTVKVGAWEE